MRFIRCKGELGINTSAIRDDRFGNTTMKNIIESLCIGPFLAASNTTVCGVCLSQLVSG